MQQLLSYWRFFIGFVQKYRTLLLCCIALIVVTLSFLISPRINATYRAARSIEKKIQERERILEEYANRALDVPVDEWLEFEDFPADMVLYRYNADTIQSWINQFPISNDEVDVLPLWYSLSSVTSKNYYNTPLAYLGKKEQYVNLGSAWYVVKVYTKERVKVIAGLLVKYEFLITNSVLTNEVNPKLSKNKKLSISPFNVSEGYIVRGIDDEILFVVQDDILSRGKGAAVPLRWLSILFLALALYSFFYNRRDFRSYLIYLLGLFALRSITFVMGESLRLDYLFFSPNIYADKGIFSSLGNLLLNNLFLFFAIFGLYLIRRRFIISYNRLKEGRRWLLLVPLIALIVCVIWYIHFTLKSIVLNSGIVLELYKLEELTRYSAYIYVSYALLFLALFLLLQVLIPIISFIKRNSILSANYILVYVFLISIYTLIMVGLLGSKKENERCMVWTNKLSVDRDISLELQLRSIEQKLSADPIIRGILSLKDDSRNILYNRLDEIYLSGINQKYEVKITICKSGDLLLDNNMQRMDDCERFFNTILTQSVPLAPGSRFFYVDNGGDSGYLGVFTYNTSGGLINMYIELNTRYLKDVAGYPAVLFGYKSSENVNLPDNYSYAKYVDNRLVAFNGGYNYPTLLPNPSREDGFYKKIIGGSAHYINKFNDTTVIISREKRGFYHYLVAFSYLVMFYLGVIVIFLRLRQSGRRKVTMNLPKKSFRRRITILLTTSLVISLICMGIGSVWFCINFYNKSNRGQMEEKLQTVQSALSDLCKYVQSYNEINSPLFYQTIDKTANNINVDVNLYDPHGRLIRSTQPELFDRFLFSSRINPNAYKEIIYSNRKQVINKEQLAELSYLSMYAPIFNLSGKLIAIINTPYFSKGIGLTGDGVTSILAAIINIYLILLLAAFLGGSAVASKISKPLAQISRKMEYIDVSTKAEHINYKDNDELGVLVRAYNKMVDDLEESTRRLAQTEREHAWSEMARQIAHEIKNPLTPMRLSIQHLVMLKRRNVEGWEDKLESIASSILEQIDILADTATEFSSFAKFYYEEKSIVDLCLLLNEQRSLFDTRDNIRMVFDYNVESAFVNVRKGQIIRVMVNLLSNAIQAIEDMGRDSRGYIRISVKQESDNYLVSFEDNGPGVKSEDVYKLFKPNFTTKSGGTGLGLAISRNIIEQSGGKIFYANSSMGGANFSFTLPIYRVRDGKIIEG